VPRGDRLRVFFDADVMTAGAASSTGASHLLLRLSELGLIEGLTCAQVLREVERNLEAKLPAALPAFRAIVAAAEVVVAAEPDRRTVDRLRGLSHPDDLPVLAAAVASRSDFLTTFNVRHYQLPGREVRIARPGEVVAWIRRALSRLPEGGDPGVGESH
jgi:predicted nucleic acid-binding protein